MPASTLSIATAITALIAVLGLIVLVARLMRAVYPGTPADGGEGLAIRAVLALDQRRRVYLIGCGPRAVLVLTGGGNDVMLGWVPPDAAP